MNKNIKVSKCLRIVKSGSKSFAYNTLLGNFCELDNVSLRIIEAIRNNYFDESVSELPQVELDQAVKKLLSRYFIVLDGFDERDSIIDGASNYQRDVRHSKRVRKLLLEVTENCNLACKYCYVKHSRELSGKNMSFETAKTAVDKYFDIISKHNAQPIVHIRFFGGEPLLQFDLIEKVCEYIDSKVNGELQVKYYINTNALLLSENIIEFLKRNSFQIGVSLDGPKEINDKYRTYKNGRGSYDNITDKVKLLMQNGFPPEDVELYVTLNDASIGYLSETVQICKELGIKNLEIEILHDFDGKYNVSDEDRIKALVGAMDFGAQNNVKVSGKWLKLYNRLKKPSLNYCGRQAEQLSVNSKGDVFVCSGLRTKFGEVERLDEIFNKDEYLALATRISGMIEPCKGCDIEGMCSGGCTGISDALFNNSCACEKNECEFRKKLVDILIKNEAEFDFFESESYQPTIEKYLLDYSGSFRAYRERIERYALPE